jgi:hypothetical protein
MNGILFVKFDRAAEFLELAAHVRDHHVSY